MGGLPELTPLLVVGDENVEALMRSARADLAKLSLELRALQREVAAAREALPADDAEPGLDLAGARELLRTGVEARIACRRVERRAEIERAQRQAAKEIADAEAEASALVHAARAELRGALAGTRSTPAPEAAGSHGPGDSERRFVTAVPLLASPPSPAASPPGMNEAAPQAPPLLIPPPPPPAVADALVSIAPPAPPSATRNRVRRRSLLHIDVLLPLLAVLIVAVVLLAWAA